MMDRGVMQRQMFAKGGAAGFPDLNKDGNVTYADILQGRGVPMQMGGEPMAAQQALMQGAIAPPPMQMADPAQAAGVPMDQAAAEAAEMGIDPNVVEQMLSQLSEGYGDIDNAETYEQVMNMMRGDNAPIEERRDELADLVGPEDAAATPESVLTLVQPIMQMAVIDQGIGGLAQEEMNTPVEGNMAGGIMSTVDMGAEEAPVPVNFNQGGAVQYMAPGGVAGTPDPRALQLFEQDKALYNQLLGGDEQQAAYDEQKRMTKAQMLFDIAQGALAFATPGDRQMSPAERLAQVAQPVLGNIGARSGELLKFKQGQDAEKRALDLAALQSSQAKLGAEKLAAATTTKPSVLAPGNQLVDSTGNVLATNTTRDPKTITLSPGQSVYNEIGKLIASMPAKPVTYNLSPGQAAYDANGNLIVERADSPQVISLSQGQIAYDINGVEIARGAEKPAVTHLLGKDQKLVSSDGTVIATGKETKQTITLSAGQKVIDTSDGSVIASGPDKFEAITLYKIDNGKVLKESVNVGTAEGLKRAETLMNQNYIAENDEAMAFINDAFAQDKEQRGVEITINEENRALNTTIAAENRLLDRTIGEEERAVLTLIAKEGRAEESVIRAEARANDTTLSTEARAEARKIAEEGRAELIKIREEGRNLETQIAKEKRDLVTQINQEKRDANRPYSKVINDVLYQIDPTKPAGKQQTVLIDGSTLPDVFGSGSLGKVMGIVSNEGLLEKYASGTLSRETDGIDTASMEAALSVYTLPSETSYNEATKTLVTQPGRPLNQAQIKALQARKLAGLSLPTNVYFPEDDIEAQMDLLLNRDKGEVVGTAPLAEFLNENAWGSPAFLKQLANRGLEAITFGYMGAPFIDAKNASAAVTNLNQEFETLFMASQEIRDSVFQGKKLEALTPDPAKFWQGEGDARAKALNLYLRLQRHIKLTEDAIADEGVPMAATGQGSVSVKRQRLPVLRDLAAGYKLLAQIDASVSGNDPAAIDRSAKETLLLQQLNDALNPKKGD